MRAWMLLPFLAGCLGETECQRRIDVAHRQALVDVDRATWAPGDLRYYGCAGLDRRPLLAYYATWCSAVDLDVLRANADAEALCLGRPTDDTAPEDSP